MSLILIVLEQSIQEEIKYKFTISKKKKKILLKKRYREKNLILNKKIFNIYLFYVFCMHMYPI